MAFDPARAKSLFLAASDIADPAGRAAYLDRECGGDADLRARVEALLRADDAPVVSDATGAYGPAGPATGTFAPGAHPVPTSDYPGRGETAGVVVGGKYTLVEAIGEGGMGSVWRARQTEPVKRIVAVKLIKAGMDSRQVLARFEAERQALALMDHPNIATVLDAGATPHGRPFFVMELVKGVPITDYCDARRLTPRERLGLFVPVCQAIQHAHQKGVIHRDIKPSNVLVALYDDRPVVKVIDFGVAKATGAALTERTIDTGFGGVVGTPQYMSPEQATFNNLDIDTRSDVYALGVLLYELLAGSPPFSRKDLEKKGLLEILRVVREEEPPRPSAKLSTADALPTLSANRGTEPKRLTGLLRTELDWVVMRALEKDRTRRYETANAFAADVQRYLAGEAVQAHPPSAAYRLRKVVRRNKGPVTAAGLLLVALLGGITGTTLGLVEARQHEQQAKTQEKLARDESDEKEKARAAAAERVKERDAALKAEGERSDELRHRLGVGVMVLAAAAYDNRDLKLAAERLDAVPAGQRGWEWRYLRRQLDGGIMTLRGHASAVTSVAFSPDGSRVVTAAGDHDSLFVAKVWDARTGLPLFDLKGAPQSAPQSGPKGNLPSVTAAFSADGTRIVTAGGDQKARIWDAATGSLRLELTEPLGGSVMCAAFSPDGARVATTTTAGVVGLVRVWDARTAKMLFEWRAHRHPITCVAFSPDGARIVTGGYDRAVRVWDAATGEARLEAKGMMSSHSGVAFSPDGARLVAGREDGTARVIDARTGDIQLVLRGRPRVSHAYSSSTTGVLSVAFSPDGTRVVTAGTTGGFGTGEASVWDARTGAEVLELKGHTAMVMSAAFSADGERVVTGSLDGTAKVWDARTGTPRLAPAGVNSPVHAAAMSADGQWLVTGGGEFEKPGEAAIWDARTGLPKFVLRGFKGPVHGVAVSRDGTRVVTGGGTGGVNTGTAPGDVIVIGAGEPDAARPDAGEATVWDARTGEPLVKLNGLKQVVGSVSISPDGTRVVTAGYLDPGVGGGTELKVWDATTGTVLLDLTQPDQQGGRVGERGGSVAFSPDGKRFVAGGVRRAQMTLGAEAKVWDAGTGKVLVDLKGNTSTILGVAFSADGTRVATAHFDKTAAVWDAADGTAVVELKGHTGNVNSVAFSPDGRRVVTGSSDRTVRVWDVRTGTTVAELKAHTGAVTSVSFSADGSQILTAAGDFPTRRGEVFVWDAPGPRGDADADAVAYRQLHTRPNPARARAAYLAARATRDDFAAAFHLNLVPPGERKAVAEQGDADAVAALNARAEEYVAGGRRDEAIPLLVEILAATKARLGPEDPATIRTSDDLGRLYHQTGQFAKAVPLLEDVARFRKAKQDPETPNAIGMLGLAYKDAGRLKDAVAVLEEAAAKDDWVQQQLLDVYVLAGEHDKVVAVCRGQLDRLRTEKDEGVVIESKANMLVRLGKAHLARKKWADAETRLRECATVLGKVEPEDWRMFESRSLLGEVLMRQQKYAEAEPLLVRSYEGLKKWEYNLQPQDAPLLPAALDRLIDLYTATNKPDELKRWQGERARHPAAVPPPRK